MKINRTVSNCPECRAMLERIEAKLDALISSKTHAPVTDVERRVKQIDLITQIKLAKTHEEQMAIIAAWNAQYRQSHGGRRKTTRSRRSGSEKSTRSQ